MNNNKKVLHIATNNSAGAGTAPVLIHQNLKKRGFFSKILVHGLRAKPEEDTLFYYDESQILAQKIVNKLKRQLPEKSAPKSEYFFFNPREDANYISPKKILKKVGFVPDVIIFYWVSNFVNTKTMRELYLATKAKIVWVVTDMGPYTGGCHYAWECRNFERDCKPCPALNGGKRAQKNLASKIKNLKDIPLEVVASYGESIEFAQNSSLFKGKTIRPHYLPVDARPFSRSLQEEAREYLGIPEDKICLFFGASDLGDRRKAIPLLIDALKKVYRSLADSQRNKVCLLIAGKAEASWFKEVGFDYHYVGMLDFDKELPMAFYAADAYLSSSIQDTGPYMVNLAIGHACPVISFDIGVAKALVEDGKNGFKAPEKSAEGYAGMLTKFLLMGKQSRLELKQYCLNISRSQLQFDSKSLEIYSC